MSLSSRSRGSRTEIREESDLEDHPIGSIIEVDHGSYSHFAVYIGERKVCHFTVDMDEVGSSAVVEAVKDLEGIVRIQYYRNIVGGKGVTAYINNSNDKKWTPLPQEDIVRRAWEEKGKTKTYNLVDYNCEHFANWLRYGEPHSKQVQNVATGAKTAGAVAVAAGVAVAKLLSK